MEPTKTVPPQDSTHVDDIVQALTFVAQQGCPELAKDASVVMKQYSELVKRAAWAQLSDDTKRSLQQLLQQDHAA